VIANAAALLLQHYVDNFRRLPWRSAPGEPPPEPYLVWLSEVMLQQTTVAAVIPRFERFVARWPSIEALAQASDEDILSEWAGLGYYARARNLIACAREVARRGGFPASAVELVQLPGIGGYTAAAISAITFGERVAAVDTNVSRVITRLHALKQPARTQLERLTLEMIPNGCAGDFTQAMMDLGATICRLKAPRCGVCPLHSHCLAYASGSPEDYSVSKTRAPRRHMNGVAYWIERDGHVWLVRRPAKGLLGGMAGLPGSDWTVEPPETHAPNLGRVRHVFTHLTLDLTIVGRSEPVGDGWWHPLDRIAEAGLPTLYRRAAELGLAAIERSRAAA
jgi:A/G-specific adenine glycosylase